MSTTTISCTITENSNGTYSFDYDNNTYTGIYYYYGPPRINISNIYENYLNNDSNNNCNTYAISRHTM